MVKIGQWDQSDDISMDGGIGHDDVTSDGRFISDDMDLDRRCGCQKGQTLTAQTH